MITLRKSKKRRKVAYSLFSFRAGFGVFISTAVSVLYTLFAFMRFDNEIVGDASISDRWKLGVATFLFLCIMYTFIVLIYRRVVIKNPLLRILDATEKIGSGDFSVRLPVKHIKHFRNEYDIMSENINRMAEELSGIETLRQDFVSNVSHEFKAPLAVMQNCCTIITQPNLSDEDRIKYAKSISDASRRMASMITNILKLNRIESQKIVEKNENINLTELLREEILLFENVWEKNHIDIEVDADESIEIRSDRELLSILWRNLLSNAFKFTPENGRVTVTVKEYDEYIYVSVADNGEGIPEDKLNRIFEKFYQVDTSHATQGNGLGLALVKSICDILGYEITAESKPGEGSNFIVKIIK